MDSKIDIPIYLKTVLKLSVRPVSHDELMGMCPNPNHQDRNPSWYINKYTGFHQCKSCGYKGGLRNLSSLILGRDKSSSLLNKLEGHEGHEIEFLEQQIASIRNPIEHPKDDLFDESSCHYYMSNLQSEPLISLEIAQRVKPWIMQDHIVNYGLKHWTLMGAYYNKLAIPIKDQTGEIINVNFRRLHDGDKQKYSCLPGKATRFTLQDTIFLNLPSHPNSTKLPYLLITEGCFDAIFLGIHGFYACSIYSNLINSKQVELILRKTNNPILCLDSDKQGLLGQGKSYEYMRDYCCVHEFKYPEYNKDPDEWDMNWLQDKLNEIM